MRDLSRLSGAIILKIEEPEVLFSYTMDERQAEYKALAKLWHPDVCPLPNAQEVFSQIARLYSLAEEKRVKKTWIEPAEKIEQEEPGVKAFKTVEGFIRRVDYLTVQPFELGVAYIGDHHVTYLVRREFDDLFDNAVKRLSRFDFASQDMRAEMMKYLPQIQDTFKTKDYQCLTVRKTPDCLLLSDVLKHMGGTLNPIGHIGWVLNCAYNVACYLQYAGICHNDISSSTYFVSPLRHGAMLLGGWWYTTDRHGRMAALPDRTLSLIPPDILRRKTSGFRTDLELIRGLGRELLGESSRTRLKFNTSIPEPLANYLCQPSAGSAFDDYNTYKHTVLEKCWPLKFIELKIEAKDLYTGATK